MIFQHTWEKVLNGTKVQTRRLVKDGEWTPFDSSIPIQEVRTANGKLKWYCSGTYVVQPGRGKKTIYYKRTPAGLSVWDAESLPLSNMPRGVKRLPPDDYIAARIRITGIRQSPLKRMYPDDAIAEGFAGPTCFHCNGSGIEPQDEGEDCEFCDGGGVEWENAMADFKAVWDTIHTTPGTRWADNPLVWVLTFELVEAQA